MSGINGTLGLFYGTIKTKGLVYNRYIIINCLGDTSNGDF